MFFASVFFTGAEQYNSFHNQQLGEWILAPSSQIYCVCPNHQHSDLPRCQPASLSKYSVPPRQSRPCCRLHFSPLIVCYDVFFSFSPPGHGMYFCFLSPVYFKIGSLGAPLPAILICICFFRISPSSQSGLPCAKPLKFVFFLHIYLHACGKNLPCPFFVQ